jgi:hypothetical protein
MAQRNRYTASMHRLATSSASPTAATASGIIDALTTRSSQYARDLNQRFHRREKMTTFYHGWSPTFLFWKLKVVFLTRLLRHLFGFQGHSIWPELPASSPQLLALVQLWDAGVHALLPNQPDIQALYAEDQSGPSYWRTLPSLRIARTTAATHRRDTLRRLHGRKRTEWRCAISERCATIEKHRQEGRIGKVIAAVSGPKTRPVDMTFINVAGAIVTDPAAIHRTATAHFQRHHRHNGIADTPVFHWDDADSIASSEQVFTAYYGPQLPPELHDTLPYLWQGFTHAWTVHPPAQVAAYRLELAN